MLKSSNSYGVIIAVVVTAANTYDRQSVMTLLTDHIWTMTDLLSYRVLPYCLDELPDLEYLHPPFEETHHGS